MKVTITLFILLAIWNPCFAAGPASFQEFLTKIEAEIQAALPGPNTDKSNVPSYEKALKEGGEQARRNVAALEMPRFGLFARVRSVKNASSEYPKSINVLAAELDWDEPMQQTQIKGSTVTVLLGRQGQVVEPGWIPAGWADFLPDSKEGQWLFITAKTEVLELTERMQLVIGIHVESIERMEIPHTVRKLTELQAPFSKLTPVMMQCPTLVGERDLWFQLKTKAEESVIFMLPAPQLEWMKDPGCKRIHCWKSTQDSAFVLCEQPAKRSIFPLGWSAYNSVELEHSAVLDPDKVGWTITGGKLLSLGDRKDTDVIFAGVEVKAVATPPVPQPWQEELWWIQGRSLTQQVGLSRKADKLWLEAFGWKTKENWFRRLTGMNLEGNRVAQKPLLCTCKIGGKNFMGIDSDVVKRDDGRYEIKADWVEWEFKDLPNIKLDGYGASRRSLVWKRGGPVFYDPKREVFVQNDKEVEIVGQDDGDHPWRWLGLIRETPECLVPTWCEYQRGTQGYSNPALMKEVETRERLNAK